MVRVLYSRASEAAGNQRIPQRSKPGVSPVSRLRSRPTIFVFCISPSPYQCWCSEQINGGCKLLSIHVQISSDIHHSRVSLHYVHRRILNQSQRNIRCVLPNPKIKSNQIKSNQIKSNQIKSNLFLYNIQYSIHVYIFTI